MNWRNEIEPAIRDHVEGRITQASTNRESLILSKNPREAQLWCALGNISKELAETNIKLKYMEKILADTLMEKKKKVRSKKQQKEIDDIVKTLARL
ncbi:hypothetical protein HON86_02355 [Candidatus Woesearchaeota archaeon]|jgi:hypothetical protein|nr:hypothetical protein [Candidatus Woesearchaeota archaeon]MBT4835438.1 hypothetical protein [Candidatus Woesearchaeota archaeon]MBT6734870.1 hypothetical protein [Candidatus Woesearchaeota archaeon]MBT7169615.1 hypothetical protein [Candidatus Woesearchaeota archaeon]MBT7474573.1 hypothetical protein [Candidatus Woesearchaeota archaeon]